MHPQPPWLQLNPNRQIRLNLRIQLRVRRQKILNRQIRSSPRMIRVITHRAWEEAVVTQQLTTVTRRQDDLVPFAFLAAPVLKRAVERVVDQAELAHVFGEHVGVEAGLLGGPLVGNHADELACYGADAVGADDEVVLALGAVGEGDSPCCEVDIATLRVC